MPYTNIVPETTAVIHRVVSITNPFLHSTDNPLMILKEFENTYTEPNKHEDIISDSYIWDFLGIYLFTPLNIFICFRFLLCF